jgi:hypothetical protein
MYCWRNCFVYFCFLAITFAESKPVPHLPEIIFDKNRFSKLIILVTITLFVHLLIIELIELQYIVKIDINQYKIFHPI